MTTRHLTTEETAAGRARAMATGAMAGALATRAMTPGRRVGSVSATVRAPVSVPASRAPAPVPSGGHSVSVLMSTYAGETAANLEASLASLRSQTVAPDQIVLVVDGPVDGGQEAVIARYEAICESSPTRFLPVRLPRNEGLAGAMNAGLACCTGDCIMRMDSDDLCLPDRVAVQIAYMRAHPEVGCVSSWAEEFFEDGSPASLKISSVSHDAVVRALRWRNVLVHPTICVRAPLLGAAGGYRTRFGLLEDYDLFVRLSLAGVVFHVVPKVLVRVRSGAAQRRRRGGLHYVRRELAFRWHLFRTGFLSPREFVLVSGLYVAFRLIAGGLRGRLYALARR